MKEFNDLLEEYKTQYLNFLSTGSAEAKAAYNRVKQGIEDAITEKREQVDREKKSMRHFARNYKEDNDQIQTVMNTANVLSEDAQQINDDYIESKNRFDEWTSSPTPKAQPVDVSNGYAIMLRVGIFLLMLPILFFVGFYTPTMFGFNQPPISSAFSTVSSPFFSPSAIHNR